MATIGCATIGCDAAAEIGALYEHRSGSAVAFPIYYACASHIYTNNLRTAWLVAPGSSSHT